jgi:hypothetical protein
MEDQKKALMKKDPCAWVANGLRAMLGYVDNERTGWISN